ncbi:MAG: Dabb family protein [Candidatus Acidiferrales bacterium]
MRNKRNAVAGAAAVAAGIAIFSCGFALGQSRNAFGMPHTVLHIVELQWKPDTPDATKQEIINGLRDEARKIPGIKNIWLKAGRVQPRDFSTAFAIEFRSRDAADNYAESEIHQAWSDNYQKYRQASISIQVTNP